MKNWIIVLAFSAVCNFAVAQVSDTVAIPMYLEGLEINILGQGSIVSMMYEKRSRLKGKTFFTSRIGLGYQEEFCVLDCGKPDRFLTLPHSMTLNLGGWRHWLEVGLGGVLLLESPIKNYEIFPIVGYRYMSYTPNRFFLRLSLHAPLEGWLSREYVIWPAALSFGASF